MLFGFLRLVAFALLFWFIYRVIIGALRYLTHDSQRDQTPRQQAQSEPKKSEPGVYHDVKDAQFTDLPDDSKKPS